MRLSLKNNWIQIHMQFPFVTVRPFLFQNSSNPDFTPNITYLLLLLEIWNFNTQPLVKRGEGGIFTLFILFSSFQNFWFDITEIINIKGATKSYGKLFCVYHKNRRKHNQPFELLFFKLNSYFGMSSYISTSREINLEIQISLLQTKEYYMFFYSVRIETTYKLSNITAAKNVFTHCACYR